MTENNTRIKHIIQEAAATFVRQESSGTGLITVTDVVFSRDKSHVMLLVSVLPENRESVVLAFLKRKRSELRTYIKAHTRLYPIPRFDFDIDYGEKNRQRIEEISQENK